MIQACWNHWSKLRDKIQLIKEQQR